MGGGESQSVDLVTAAQALHWFDLEGFYAQVRRVLRPGGILAAWCYHLTQISPELDGLLEHYYTQIVGPYWSARVRLVNEHYRSLPFPFPEIEVPEPLAAAAQWSLTELIGYLHSWFSTQTYWHERGSDPVAQILPALAGAWGAPEERRVVHWPLYFRIGRIPPAGNGSWAGEGGLLGRLPQGG